MTEQQAAAKDWLNRNFFKHEELKALTAKLEEMRASVSNLSAPVQEVKVQTQPRNGTPDKIAAVLDFEKKLQLDKELLNNSEVTTINTIGKLKNAKQRTILYNRYCLYLPWRQISKRMGYTENYCQELHMIALAEIYKFIDFSAL